MKRFLALLKESALQSKKDGLARLAAALAYYAIFSLAPLLILTIAITGIIFQDQIVAEYLVSQTRENISADVAVLVRSIVEQSPQSSSRNLVTSIFAAIILLFVAAGIFRQIKGALNKIWNISSKKTKGFFPFLFTHFIAALSVIGAGLLLSGTIFLTAGFSLVQETGILPGSGVFQVFELLDIFFSFALISMVFAALFKFFPDRRLTWKEVFPGAMLSAALFVIGKYFVGLYLALSGLGASYGAAGTLLILLFWIYVAALLFLFGAEFTKKYIRSA
ncbi:MAG: YihY/virulence factor BrkB family protein [Candidatus Harrisonbacteria bacterium]|nr:YihY/virulence factor BrkB family protein [Candidatus Harrisonbacteria bacterium]